MKDPEFIELRNKFLLAVLVALAFTIPVIFIFKNRLVGNESSILKELKNNKEIVILVTDKDCNNCNKYKKVLDNYNVNYKVLNKDTNRDYEKILQKISLNKKIIVTPTIIYTKKGKTISFITDINSSEELKTYIENYKLSK